uniref:PDZ domain-containing protein n=1 Tax=Emiliania huxleyi TaxID=2903 RepID=A0A7S3SB06_EMIHU
MNPSSLTLLAVLASVARAVRVGQPAQRAGSREVVARASATATAAAAYSTWADLASEPQLLPEAQAARTVMEVSPIAQLCLASSADGVDGTVCARLVAGSPSRPEPVRLAGGDQIFGVDEDGSPLFGLRPGSQAALDIAASASVSFAAHAPTGGAQAGCAVTLLGPAAEAELPAELAKKLARQTGVGKEELEGRQWWRLAPCHVHFTDALHARLSRSGNAPLDFSITHNLHAQTEKTELHFSLSNTSLKLFSTLTVEPHSRTQ